jgi:hypothetical protein
MSSGSAGAVRVEAEVCRQVLMQGVGHKMGRMLFDSGIRYSRIVMPSKSLHSTWYSPKYGHALPGAQRHVQTNNEADEAQP